jgi:hypothetical protein
MEGEARARGMTYSTRCLLCDLAFEMRMSEQQFYDEFDLYERSQLLATYRSRLNRDAVMARFPPPPRKGKK